MNPLFPVFSFNCYSFVLFVHQFIIVSIQLSYQSNTIDTEMESDCYSFVLFVHFDSLFPMDRFLTTTILLQCIQGRLFISETFGRGMCIIQYVPWSNLAFSLSQDIRVRPLSLIWNQTFSIDDTIHHIQYKSHIDHHHFTTTILVHKRFKCSV